MFVNLLEKIRDGLEIENVRAYLLRSARNRCYNSIRDRKYAKDVDELHDVLPGGEEADADQHEELHAALRELPDDNREALLLCEFEGYSYDEIATITAVPVSTVRKRIFRARRKLRETLSPGTTRM